ncbi:MAG: hypothetical protein WKF70_14125 [Chitinophagaceae bacterium]
MKPRYPVFLLLLLTCLSYTSGAQILTFSFSGNNGDEATVPSTANAVGVQPSSISRGAGITAAAAGDRFNAVNWTTSPTPDLSDYIEYTVSPAAGYSIDIASIELQHRRSTTGPRKFVIRTSLDGFASNATNEVSILDVNTQQNNAFALITQIRTTVPVTFRIYAYAAETTTGSWGPGEVGADLKVFGTLAILPVKFKNEKAAGAQGSTRISWTNAIEADVKEYIIEYSTNGLQFKAIGSINPEKNNGEEASYVFHHNKPAIGTGYYRIKAIEQTGMVIYSIIITYKSGYAPAILSILSNPLQGNALTYSMTNLPAGRYTLLIYNGSGQTIKKEIVNHIGGAATATVYLTSVGKGIYYLRVGEDPQMQRTFLVN